MGDGRVQIDFAFGDEFQHGHGHVGFGGAEQQPQGVGGHQAPALRVGDAHEAINDDPPMAYDQQMGARMPAMRVVFIEQAFNGGDTGRRHPRVLGPDGLHETGCHSGSMP